VTGDSDPNERVEPFQALLSGRAMRAEENGERIAGTSGNAVECPAQRAEDQRLRLPAAFRSPLKPGEIPRFSRQ